MPYALVLHCFPQNGTITSQDLQGQKGLALFLQEMIQQQDAALSAQLHAPQNPKPFTTAILLPTGEKNRSRGPGKGKQPILRSALSPNAYTEEIKIRITLLWDMLYPVIAQFFLCHIDGPPVLRLGQSPLLISRLTVTPESGEIWSGYAGFPELWKGAPETETTWTIHFATPTTFKAGEANLPLPLPRLCFQSWLQSWDTYSGLPFFSSKAERQTFLTEVVERQVSLEYTQIRMHPYLLYFEGRQPREYGFVGTCRFSIRPTKVAPQDRKRLATLVRYSFYSGTGKKTTMGMGVTRPVSLGKE
ncbi:MAG: CRISPR system precrRNA processing endoribonuclease RAMP protein Cas6 [Nitrospinota bacterium]|nr:MAG: CRISPR system precrRNA processing endoribonuclease RAMP protein Cas6 [Nitrospinota bacterium]